MGRRMVSRGRRIDGTIAYKGNGLMRTRHAASLLAGRGRWGIFEDHDFEVGERDFEDHDLR